MMINPPGTPARSRRSFLAATLSSTLGAAALTACGSDASPATQNTLTPLQAQPAGGGGPAVEQPVANGNEALQRLVDGNARFAGNQAQHVDEGLERRIAVSSGQHPFATVLGCVDSRVPVELVFDRGLGDLVVVRSAGEALDRSVIGSLEFGVAELGTPLLMVLGHQRCGAVDATIKALDAKKTEDEGDIDYLVEAITPAVQQVSGKPGDRLTNAVHANVALVLTQLRKSPVLGPLEKAGKVKLVGAYYELDTGKVIVS
jgi:carbonic anhydrase